MIPVTKTWILKFGELVLIKRAEKENRVPTAVL